MYGQTGSGKTHTMAGIEEFSASALLPAVASDMPRTEPRAVLQFYEVKGDRCVDLLSAERGKELMLANDASGTTQLLGATTADINSAEELIAAIAQAKSRRATHATGANAASSRSHAVCQLELRVGTSVVQDGEPPLQRKRARAGGAILTLVDCAGSERKEDSAYHNSDRRKEVSHV
eukprot:scaffold89477_cov27-Tisochrysis_lutea.AAC.6